MMKTLTISGIAILMAALPAVAQAGDSRGMRGVGTHGGGIHKGGGIGIPNAGPRVGGARNWGPRSNGRWFAGGRAPGGWNGYRRPFVGYTLPSYWINPTYYVGNYSTYGFSRPSNGFGWSRYYDDAVLTDRSGRVQDYVEGVQWDQYDRYDDGDDSGFVSSNGEDYADSYGYRDEGGRSDGYDRNGREFRGRGRDRDGGLGGAIAGGAVGAIAGTVIGGRGNRTEGAILGGILGAGAGAAIDAGDRFGRGYKTKRIKTRRGSRDRDLDYDYGYGQNRDGVTQNGQWQGQWTGQWNGGPTQSWEGTYQGTSPHWGGQGGPSYGQGQVIRHQGSAPVIYRQGGPSYGYDGGYSGGGYGGEVTTIVIQQSQPIVTTTTTTSEEVVYASAPRKRYVARKVWKPRPKARCVCKVVYR